MIDPWAGSYLMESLTQQVYDEAKRIVDEVWFFIQYKMQLIFQNFI